MNKNNPLQYAGVWMDNEKAVIISRADEAEATYSITNKLKATAHHAGGSEHAINNAHQGETIKYFKSLAAMLQAYDEILVFGPGKAQEQFQNYVNNDAPFKNKKIHIDSGEHLTDPQMIAKVKAFFKSHQ